MNGLKLSETYPRHNPWKSDVFAAGMTFLEAANLKSCASCYDIKNYKIDSQMLDELLCECEQRMGCPFTNTLR